MKTYILCQGKDSNDNNILGYYYTLKDAKEDLERAYPYKNDLFILRLEGFYFGEGYDEKTWVMNNHGRYKCNTKL